MKKDWINVWHTIAAAMIVKNIKSGYLFEEASPTGRVTRKILTEDEASFLDLRPRQTITPMFLDFAKRHLVTNFEYAFVDGNTIPLNRPLVDSHPDYGIDEVIELEEAIWSQYPPSIAKYICNILNPSIKECKINLLESDETYEFTVYHRSRKVTGYITKRRKWDGEVEVQVELSDDVNLVEEEQNDIINHLKSKF
jgi:hypothetical protein